MEIDISHINPDDVGPNSLIIARLDLNEGMNSDQLSEVVQALKSGLKDRFDPTVRAIVLPDTVTLETIPEEQMNAAGWFKLGLPSL